LEGKGEASTGFLKNLRRFIGLLPFPKIASFAPLNALGRLPVPFFSESFEPGKSVDRMLAASCLAVHMHAVSASGGAEVWRLGHLDDFGFVGSLKGPRPIKE